MRMSVRLITAMFSSTLAALSSATLAAMAAPPPVSVTPPGQNAALGAAIRQAQDKLDQARAIVQNFRSRADTEGLGESWSREMLNAMMQSPVSTLSSIASSATAREALAAAVLSAHTSVVTPDATATEKSLGSDHIDLTYIPIYASCRLVDTRQVNGGGPIAAGGTRKFSISAYSGQGGSCDAVGAYFGINHNAPAALAINVTIDATSFPGGAGSFIQVYPDGSTPVSSWLNFSGGDVLANSGIIQVPANLAFDITASAKTNVIVDVVGAFTPPNPTPLTCATATASTTIVAGSTGSIATASCGAGTAQTGGGCAMTFINSTISRSYPFNNTWNCSATNTTALTDTLTAYSTCCKVPGGPNTP